MAGFPDRPVVKYDAGKDSFPMGETDKAYKLLFEHKEMVASLLRDFVQEAAIADLDLDTLEP